MSIPLALETEQRIIRKALLSRLVEERFLRLFSEGKLHGTVHTCIGQEFTGAVLTEFLHYGDTLFSNHRCHGHFLSFTGETNGLIAELMGRVTGVCGGVGGSQHLYKDGFYSNGIQGGGMPVAAGCALAHKLNKTGHIAVSFIGDGTLGEGVVYETMNIAAKWQLPLLIVLEDNGYAQSTPKPTSLAGDILKRAEAFGIRTFSADTWNWREMYWESSEVVKYVRETSLPAFLLVNTFRLRAHSKGDDSRPRSEVEPFEKKDPLNILMQAADPAILKMAEELSMLVNEAVALAERAPYPEPIAQAASAAKPAWTKRNPKKARVVDTLNESLTSIFKRDSKALMIGEDILSPYGGAFKVTQGLSEIDPARVFSTPISEAAITGIGTGLALSGFRPFVEIMFGDFVGLAFDQIVNHAAKFEEMYRNQVRVPLVVRAPMGGGRGYGPTHSQTLDRYFMGTPGLRVLATNHLINPAEVYAKLAEVKTSPTLVIENKLQYSSFLYFESPDGFELNVSDEEWPTAWLRPQAQTIDVTLLGYGGVSDLLTQAAEKLFVEHDIVAQVVCPTQIYPFDIASLEEVISESPRLVIVEEGQGFASFGSEVIAQLSEQLGTKMPRIMRLHPKAGCIPSCADLERELLPSVDSIVRSTVKVCL